MKRDRIKRRSLYSITAVAWVVAGYFLKLDLDDPGHSPRTWMVFTLAVAAVLSTTSLFVWFIPTDDAIYKAGMEAGQRMSGCSAFRPILTAVDGQRAVGDTVTSIRTLHTRS